MTGQRRAQAPPVKPWANLQRRLETRIRAHLALVPFPAISVLPNRAPYPSTACRACSRWPAIPVSPGWSLTPDGLQEGDEFRLLFIHLYHAHSPRRPASATYNSYVQNRAAAGHTDIQDYSDTFRVVGCTAAVDARDNTYTTYTSGDKGPPIYWLNGNQVVDHYKDFYDGDWDDQENPKTEAGAATSATDHMDRLRRRRHRGHSYAGEQLPAEPWAHST